MQLTILGGGGFRTPLVYRALTGSPARGLIDRVVLYDVDDQRLNVSTAVLEGMRRETPAPSVHATSDLDEALTGADFVFVAMRVGGTTGRVIDESVALRHGVLGQETIGPGGIAFGLRTVPVAVRIAQRIAALAPNAWVINFTNPAGMITEAMASHLGDRVIGICDSPAGLVRRVAQAAGCGANTSVVPRYAGLNHLGWLTGLIVDGSDRLPDLLDARDDPLGDIEEGRLFGSRWLQNLRMVPNEYLYYFYFAREALAAISGREPRGEFIARTQSQFYRAAADERSGALRLWRAARDERDRTYLAEARADGQAREKTDVAQGGYEAIAMAVMAALAGRGDADVIVNVRGNGALPYLPDEAVVEVVCHIDESGARPGAVDPLPGHAAGLVQQVKQVEQLTVQAAMERSARSALQAIALHPLVDSVLVARELLAEYGRRHPELEFLAR